MDPLRFDRLSRALAACGPRRGVLGLLAALPVAGSLLPGGRLPLQAAALATTRKRKKAKDKKGKRKDRSKGKDKQRTNAQAEVCWRAGACIVKKGANVSQCDLAGYTAPPNLDCTRCNISRANLRGANLSGVNLTAANLSGSCLIDANLTGAIIANTTNLYNAIFCNTTMPNGSVNNSGCESGTTCCSTCTPTTCQNLGKSCGEWPDGCDGTLQCGSCGTGQLCDDGACPACDVCASGCAHRTVQSAIEAAGSGATIRICPGTYGRTYATGEVARIFKNLTLVGAGSGANGTILDGGGTGSGIGSVVAVSSSTVELRDLSVTRGVFTSISVGGGIRTSGAKLTLTRVRVHGNAATQGGGIITSSSTLTLNDTTVTKNSAESGGGILNVNLGTVILNAGATVTENTASRSGGGIENLGTVIRNPGSSVTGNISTDCVDVNSGTGCS